MNKATYEALNNLEEHEIQALYSIYLYRCLTYKQIYRMHYINKFNNISDFENNILEKWISLGLAKKVFFKHNNYVLFLTTRGVDIIRIEYKLQSNIFDSKNQVVKRGYFRANELEMHPRLINHQIHLNQFVIDFKRYSKKLDKDYNTNLFDKIRYFDEKHMSQYNRIRPDGLLSIYDIDFFIETDMSTENKKQLLEKWENYRMFLTSNEFKGGRNQRIVVLFVIENSKDLEKRKNLVKRTCADMLLDKLDYQYFDIYVGSAKEILEIIFNDILPAYENRSASQNNLLRAFSEEDFLISHGYNVKERFENIEYNYYIRKINPDGTLKKDGHRPIEFLVDDFRAKPLSILKRISYHTRNDALFKISFKRNIPLLVICNSTLEIFDHLNLIDYNFDLNPNVFFIDIDNLIPTKNKSLCNYIYQFDNIGNIFGFTDYSLSKRYYIKHIDDLLDAEK